MIPPLGRISSGCSHINVQTFLHQRIVQSGQIWWMPSLAFSSLFQDVPHIFRRTGWKPSRGRLSRAA